jgi:hypothetical protein
VETIVNMLPNLQADTLKFTIIPLVKKMCEESLKAEDSVMVKISEQFGKLCLGLENFFTPQEKAWILHHYQKMAELGLPHVMKSDVPDYGVMPDVVPANTDNHIACRHNCAYNLPAMTTFCSTAGKVDNFIQHLYSTFQNLACDPYFMIRQTVACGLYEIAHMLGSTSSVLKPELIRLLRDDAEEVLQALVPHLGKILVLLAKVGTFSPDFMDAGAMDIGQALLKCEAEISMTTNWRLHAMTLGQLECLPHCMPSDFIYSHFIPIIFDRIYTARPVPCRMAAARTMLVFLRYNVKETQRNAIRAHIDTDLHCSDSCYKRMLYVNMCDTAVDLFSRCYFKEYFFMPLIGLSDDQVPNIRLKVVMMLPKLKAMLCLPGDHKLLTSLEACVRSLLLHEKDRDVKAQLHLTVQALDAIEVGVEVVGSPAPASRENIEDQRKADEEKKLSGTGSSLRKWKVWGQTDVKRRSVEVKNAPELSVAERRICLSSIPVSRQIWRRMQHPTTSFDGCPPKSPMNSLEDEFYVDAGIQIPQQLATSGFAPLPSRIPNLREILFRNHSTLSSTNVQNLSGKEMKTDSEVSSDARDGSLKSKPNFSATNKVATKPSNVSATSKSPVSVNTTTKKASVPGHMNRRNSGVLSGDVDCQTQQTSRGKMSVSNKQNPGVHVTVVNRQQSYMEKDRAVKMKSSDINNRKKGSGMSENKRGSCLESLQLTALDDAAEKHIETYTVHKLNTQRQNLSETKLSTPTTTTFMNRRHSYSSVVQNNRSNARNVPLIKRGAASNCHSIGPEADKSVFNSQSHIKRGTSLDRETESDVTVMCGSVKRRSMVTPSTVKHTTWRHSSLERDSMDRLTLQAQGQAKSLNRMVDINKMECNRNTPRELHSVVDDVGSGSKGNNTSRIPRGGGGGGGRSCHSSPGNSRATSPTILGCSSRFHQKTAPNSRASSPTRAEKLQQRLSVGSLSCYMGSLKLPESGTSRLPVRNLSRLQ